jgi:hypothetical protein
MMRSLWLLLFVLLPHTLCLYAACGKSTTEKTPVVDHYIDDAVLHRRWAVMTDCSHPERPWVLMEVPSERAISMSPKAMSPQHLKPSIAAGAEVQLWSVNPDASVHLLGIALDAGAKGQIIHVRLRHSTTVLEGRVCEAGSAELVIRDRWKSR